MATTGNRLLVEFSRTPDVNFFLCRQCRTHIALTRELLYRSTKYRAGVFRDVVNVKVEDPDVYHRMANYTASVVFCTRCNSNLGWKMIEVAEDHPALIPGRFALFLHMLLKWDGTQMVYAHTNEPVENA